MSEFRERLDAILEEQDYDLLESLVNTARGADPIASADGNEVLKAQHAMQARRLLVDYAYPKLKNIEATVAEPVKVIITDERDLADE